LTTVDISHAGGSVLDVTEVVLKVDGNESTWEMKTREDCGTSHDKVKPTPNIRAALGTNQVVEFSSGETWSPYIRNGPNRDRIKKPNRYEVNYESNPDDVSSILYYGPDSFSTPIPKKIESGHEMSVVWSASSGGKTQTLFKYTVQ
jgi:hypothetical protein